MTENEPTDWIASLLRHLAPSIRISFRGQVCAPWNVDTSGSGRITFHITHDTTTWLHLPDAPPVPIAPGHVLILPGDTAHVLTDTAHATPRYGVIDAGVRGQGRGLSLVCGFIDVDTHSQQVLKDTLPAALIVPTRDNPVGELTLLLFREADRLPSEDDPAFIHLAHALLTYALRLAFETHGETLEGIAAALTHPRLGRVVHAMLECPDHNWSVAALAALTHQSRSVFASTFRKTVGCGPMEWLTHYRMQRACRLLLIPGAQLPDVAMQCGYQSEAAFSKAFKRVVGCAPGEARRRGEVL